MTDILVRWCSVRVVRRGGWGWGTDSSAMIEALRQWLTSVLGEELELALAGSGPRTIAAPVRVRLPVKLADLATCWSSGGPPLPGAPAPASVTDVLRAGLRRAVLDQLGPPPEHKLEEPPPPLLPQPEMQASTANTPKDPRSTLRLLAGWLRTGRIQFHLRAFTVPALRVWHQRALEAPSPTEAGRIPEPPAETVQRLAGQGLQLVADLAREPGDRAILVARLLVLATLEAAVPGSVSHPGLRAALDVALPLPASARAVGESRRGSVPADPAPASPARTDVLAAATSTRRARASVLEWRIETALPLIMLGPLARMGWLETAAAVFDMTDTAEDLPLLGVALARKTLPIPLRGWARTEAAQRTAAACGLLAQAPPDGELLRVARAMRDHLSILDALIADNLCGGHRPGAPLVLTLVESGLLLSDPDGAFPIAQASDLAGLAPHLRLLPGAVVLVSAEAASPDLLAGLDALGSRFATGAAPGRGETWHKLTRRERAGIDLWTNDPGLEAGALPDALAEVEALAGPSWHAIATERTAIAVAPEPAFEASLGLAASLALGSIAWALWGEHGRVAPGLALSRFADFDGVLRADAREVTVSLPLGRRFFDLREHGFLDDVRALPWFGGRTLHFQSG